MIRAAIILLAILFLTTPRAAVAGSALDDDAFGDSNTGERFFLETRFAKFFFTNSGSNANATLASGDPVMNTTASIYGPLPGPFAGQSMNCRACHLVEEQENIGNRTYCDFAPRSPIPDIGDGRSTTTRNAMPLVNALLTRTTPLFLHFDGQFSTPEDLIIATLTGRNYGWEPSEYETAIHHIAHIVRADDGSGGLAQQYGGWSYAVVLQELGEVQTSYSISPPYYMDVTETDTNSPNYVTDEQIVENVAALIHAYLETLVFSQDDNGNFTGSPFDVFLIKNGLPQQPNFGETPLQYGRRLLRLVAGLHNPQFVTDPGDGHFITNAKGQPFQFGTNELAGLEIFLADTTSQDIATNLQTAGITAGVEVGNCIACHAPPAFTDFLFHNTGAAQEEYDSIFGAGAFSSLPVPGLAARQTNYNAWLPPTTNHPNAAGVFDLPPAPGHPGQVDLGLWNVFANPDFSAPQDSLQQILPQILPGLSPRISGPGLSGSNIFFTATNGSLGLSCEIVAATNLSLPLSEWTVIATNTFDGSGHFAFTNVIDPAMPQRFYALIPGALPSDAALSGTLALFKTPTVRDLVSSEPYLHTGRMNTIEDMISFYQTFSGKARAGGVRNAAPEMSGIFLDDSATAPLAAFIRALDEENYADIPCPCQ